jgi:transposase InsO family protein
MPRLGTRKLYHILKEELKEIGIGRDKLFTILKANHMLIKAKKTYTKTTNSYHRFKKHKNLIKELEITRPNQVWVADITYVGNRENPMYLSLITDAYSKQIMGFDVSDSLHAKGATRALQKALKKRKDEDQSLIHHSDRGLQYCSNQYQEILTESKVKCSMTESYDPYENAVAERINGILKQEFIQTVTINQIHIMKKIVEESINIYNTKRPHTSCNMLTPIKMHQQNEIKYKKYKKLYRREASFSSV